MDEILRKRIEDKAADYADDSYPEYFPQYRTAEAAFEAGAEFALSHQWIRVEEALPKYDEAVIVRNCNGEIFLLSPLKQNRR